LTTLYVEYDNLEKFTVNGETGVLAQAIAQQYYRFLPFLVRALHQFIKKYKPEHYITVIAPPSSPAKPLHIAFYNLSLINSIRSLRTSAIGKLVSISGTVTRTSEVRPELVRGVFQCQDCRTTVEGVEQVFRYTEPRVCPNEVCMNKVNWRLNLEGSTFGDWQKCRIQENSSEIPTGSMPRTYAFFPDLG